MGKRKVSILKPAATAVAEIALFIESEGLPQTAKKFVDDVFLFFEKLSWKDLDYRCVPYKKKYVVAYLSQEKKLLFVILSPQSC